MTKPQGTCTMNDCERHVLARGLCGRHYQSEKKSGRIGTHDRAYETHGMYDSPEYRSWQHMRQRCHNPDYPRFADWGGRGITVCDAWRGSFAAFLADMGPKPSPVHTLDRIDNDAGYSPENCRWATPSQQQSNQRPHRDRRLLAHDGVLLSVREWADRLGLRRDRIYERLARGCSDAEALSVTDQRARASRPK